MTLLPHPYADIAERMYRDEYPDASDDAIILVRSLAMPHDLTQITRVPTDYSMLPAVKAWLATMQPRIDAAVAAGRY